MKKILLAIACVVSLNCLQAQDDSEDISLIQDTFGKDKRDLVSEYMQVPEKDSIAFWKLYDEYESQRKALGKERIDLLQEYADEYENLTDAKAGELAARSLDNDAKYTALYQAYLKKFSTVSGTKNAAKLLQLEIYLQTLVRVSIMTNIPFIGQLEQSQGGEDTDQ